VPPSGMLSSSALSVVAFSKSRERLRGEAVWALFGEELVQKVTAVRRITRTGLCGCYLERNRRRQRPRLCQKAQPPRSVVC
jgi:hypothetical protein